MDASRFDRLARQVSRRGIVALLGAAVVSGDARDSAANGVGPCGGTPTGLTRLCGGAGACSGDVDCTGGCVCLERRTGCCYTKRTKRGGKRRRCVDGAPASYCTPIIQ